MINDDRSINVAGLLVVIMRLTLTLSENYTQGVTCTVQARAGHDGRMYYHDKYGSFYTISLHITMCEFKTPF